MLRDVVRVRNVFDGDPAVACLVQHVKGHSHEALPPLVHVAAQADQELVEGDAAVAVAVKVGHELLELLHVQGDAVVLQPVLDLVAAESPVAAVVHDPQRARDTPDADGLPGALDDLRANPLHYVRGGRRFGVAAEALR